MSIRVMTTVWENSKATGGELLVMLALADFANDAVHFDHALLMNQVEN